MRRVRPRRGGEIGVLVHVAVIVPIDERMADDRRENERGHDRCEQRGDTGRTLEQGLRHPRSLARARLRSSRSGLIAARPVTRTRSLRPPSTTMLRYRIIRFRSVSLREEISMNTKWLAAMGFVTASAAAAAAQQPDAATMDAHHHADAAPAPDAVLRQERRSMRLDLHAPAGEAFPLFGPVREGEWVPSWDPQFAAPSPPAQGPDGAVF